MQVGPLNFTLKAYSDAFLGKADLDLSGGDKIILHPSVLESLGILSVFNIITYNVI